MEIIEKREYPYKEIYVNEVIESKSFRKCKFNSCYLSYLENGNPSDASIVRNCEFIDCHATENTSQTGGILENVLIHNLKNTGVLFLKNVLFNKVIFKGKIGKVSIDSKIENSAYIFNENGFKHRITEQEIVLYDEFRVNFYKNVDFALDISEAEFKYCEIYSSVPAHLIKRDSETQALIKYNKVLERKWERNKILSDSILKYSFSDSLREKADVVFIAPKGDKNKFTEYMELIKILREEGIAELD